MFQLHNYIAEYRLSIAIGFSLNGDPLKDHTIFFIQTLRGNLIPPYDKSPILLKKVFKRNIGADYVQIT